MDVIFGVLLTLLLIMALSITTIVVVVRAVVKRLRRSRAVGGAVLRTRAKVATGPRGRVLRLRVRLREALESGRAAMDVAANGTGPRGDLKRLFTRIEHEGESLDLQLRLLESETDVATLNAELPTADRRVDQVCDLVRRLRAAVAAGLGDVSDDALAELHADVDREVAALHAGVQELRLLNQRDALGARPRAIRRAA